MPTKTIKDPKSQTFFFLALLILSLVLLLFILKPYLGIFILAGALCVVFDPLNKTFLKIFRQKRSLAAICSVLFVLIISLIPLAFFSSQIIKEASSVYQNISQGPLTTTGVIDQATQWIRKFLPNYSFDLQVLANQGINFALRNFTALFSGITNSLISLSLGLITLFYFFRDSRKIKKSLMSLSPLQDKYDEQVFKTVRSSINSVVKGSLLIAIIQGILVGIGFKIFGIPNSALWGSLAVLASLIPGIGNAVITIPAILFLFFTHKIGGAIGLAVWSILFVSMADNLLRGKLMQKEMPMHPLLILFSVLGGIALFGPIGFLTGPIITSLFFALIKIYPEIVLKNIKRSTT